MERRKFVIGLGALTTGSAAAVGSGAFTAAELDARDANIEVVDDTDGLIGLEAGSSELVSDDGGTGDNELVIDFNPEADGKGVNPNSAYQVGGLGGIDNLDEIPGAPDEADAVLDRALDTSTPIYSDYAFKLTNQSGSEHAIEVTYDANEADFPGDTIVYMVSWYEDGSGTSEEVSALAAAATPDARRASILYTDDADWSTAVGSGGVVKVALLVDVNGADTGEDLGGDIIVRAGSHDEFIDPDAPE